MICRPDHVLKTVLVGLLVAGSTACSAPEHSAPPAEMARQALSAGDGLGAEVILRQMLADGTPRRDVAALLGEAELQQGAFQEARKWLGGADFAAADQARGFHMLGRLELAEGRLPQAGQAFDNALKFSPDDPELWVDIGRLRYRGGEQAQAVEASLHAARLGPKNAAALQFRGQLVRDAQGMQASIPWFEAALNVAPDDVALLGDYAATLGEMGHARTALETTRQMLALAPRNGRALYIQAVIAARAGKFDLARNLLARSGDYGQQMPAGMLLSAIIDLERGNFASAAQTLDLLQAQQPGNTRIRNLLARSLSLGGNHRELVHRFGSTQPHTAMPPYLATLVGRSYEILGDRENAAPFLDHAALRANSALGLLEGDADTDADGMSDLANAADAVLRVRTLISEGRSQAAIEGASAMLLRNPGSADAMGLAGDAYLSANQPARALELYQQAGRIRQLWPLGRRIVHAHIALGRDEDALHLLQRALLDQPSNTEAAVMLAGMESARGDYSRAQMVLGHALLHGRSRDPDVMSSWAWAMAQNGDGQSAGPAMMAAYRLQRMNGSSTARLGQLLAADPRQSQQAWALLDKAAKLPTGS